MFGDPVENEKGWEMIPLSELGTCKNGMNFASDEDGIEIAYLGVGDFKDNSRIDGVSGLSQISLNTMPSEEYLLKDEDIVFVRSNGSKELVGRCLAVYPGNEKLTFSGFCIRWRKNSDKVMTDFLLQVLKTENVRILMRGRGANIQNLNQQILGKLMIPVPNMALQQSFVEFVGAIDKSRFIEMFGDPVENEKGWEMIPLSELGTCKNGMNFASDEDGIEIAYLGVGDFKDNSRIDGVSGLSQISLNTMPSEEYLLKDEDIVFVRSNGSKELVGRCLAVYPGNEKLTFSGFCIRWRKNSDKVMTDFLLQVLKTENVRILMRGRGANIQNLNQQILGKLMIPVPNMALQQSFVEFVGAIDKSKLAIYKIKKNVLGRRLAT